MCVRLCVRVCVRRGGARWRFPQFVLFPLSKMNIFLSTMRERHRIMNFSVQNPRCPESRAQVLLIILLKNVTSPRPGIQGRFCLPLPRDEALGISALQKGPGGLVSLRASRFMMLGRSLKTGPHTTLKCQGHN